MTKKEAKTYGNYALMVVISVLVTAFVTSGLKNTDKVIPISRYRHEKLKEKYEQRDSIIVCRIKKQQKIVEDLKITVNSTHGIVEQNKSDLDILKKGMFSSRLKTREIKKMFREVMKEEIMQELEKDTSCVIIK
jgi:hypothetical protein